MDDLTYYSRRAERQLDLAQRASNPAVCRSHYDLANLYLAKATSPTTPPQERDIR